MDTEVFTRVNVVVDSASLNWIKRAHAEEGVDFIEWANQNPRAAYDYFMLPHKTTPPERTIFHIGQGNDRLSLDSREIGPTLVGAMLPDTAEASLDPNVSTIIFNVFEDVTEATDRVNGGVPTEMVLALARPILSVFVLPPSESA